MKIIKDLDAVQLHNTAVSIGKFDGIHAGHQLIFKELADRKKQGMTVVVFTFDRSPKTIRTSEQVRYIFTEQEKYYYYEQMGVDILIEYTMSKEFLDLSPREFVKKILVDKLDVRFFCAGTDFHFGKGRLGDVRMLTELGSEFGFEVEIIKKKQYHSGDLSSTRVRGMIAEGKMEEAKESMGHAYAVHGVIVHGKQLGRKVGMPTINLLPDESKLLPPNGVYAARVLLEGRVLYGITNVGCKPTVSNTHQMTIETYLFDFQEDVYGKEVWVELHSFIRPEKKFPSLEDVKKQVDLDIEVCKHKMHLK